MKRMFSMTIIFVARRRTAAWSKRTQNLHKSKRKRRITALILRQSRSF